MHGHSLGSAGNLDLSRKIWLQYYTAYCSLICLKHNALEELVQSTFEDGYRFGLQVVQFLVYFRGRTSGVVLYMSFLMLMMQFSEFRN